MHVMCVHLLLFGLCQVGAVDRAMEVFRQMQEVAVAPTIITFNSILDACARNGDAVRAAQVTYDTHNTQFFAIRQARCARCARCYLLALQAATML
jgi:pentatricopeptide repeat protein